VYIWIAKDLSWTQNWFFPAHFFAVIALICAALLLARSIKDRNSEEIWHTLSHVLWLFGNYWWMSLDVRDSRYDYDFCLYSTLTVYELVLFYFYLRFVYELTSLVLSNFIYFAITSLLSHPFDAEAYNMRLIQAGNILAAALMWLLLWYLVMRPLKIFPLNEVKYSFYILIFE
jgi:hypothetical protein